MLVTAKELQMKREQFDDKVKIGRVDDKVKSLQNLVWRPNPAVTAVGSL